MLQIFGISGRIGRVTWWLVQVGTIFLGLMLHYLFDPTMGIDQAEWAILKNNPEKVKDIAKSLIATTPLFLVTGIASHWLFVTSCVQRLHDRGSTGWRVLFFYLPIVILIFSIFTAVANGSWMTVAVGALLFIAGAVLSLVWLIVECGMLPGDESENDYGTPPGSEARKSALEGEIAALAGHSTSGITKLDDNYIAEYAKKIATQQATQQMPAANTLGPSGARPAFGKR
jgi:uncharacterized membrane protein YhaH (DUF805 family)